MWWAAKQSSNLKIDFMTKSEAIAQLNIGIIQAKEDQNTTFPIHVPFAESLVNLLAADLPSTPENEPESPTSGGDPDFNFDPTEQTTDLDPLSPEAIAKNLEHRRQKAKAGVAFGKPIPQVKIEPEDVEKALKNVKGVTVDYMEQYGFLTHVYQNAAKRSGTDISKIKEGLSIKFE